MISYQHKSLAAGRWSSFSFLEQMAHIGSEVERALNWREKKNPSYAQQAFERALELMDLTLANTKGFPRLKEIARMREVLVDYFYGANEYGYTGEALKRYFLFFAYAARRR